MKKVVLLLLILVTGLLLWTGCQLEEDDEGDAELAIRNTYVSAITVTVGSTNY